MNNNYHDLTDRKDIADTVAFYNSPASFKSQEMFGKHEFYGKTVDEASAIWEATARETEDIINVLYLYAENANLLADDGSVGIRITSEIFSKALCEQLRRPIVSTSANFSGEPTARFFTEIKPELLEAVDYVCAYRRQDNTTHAPSSIVKIDEKERITIIRE